MPFHVTLLSAWIRCTQQLPLQAQLCLSHARHCVRPESSTLATPTFGLWTSRCWLCSNADRRPEVISDLQYGTMLVQLPAPFHGPPATPISLERSSSAGEAGRGTVLILCQVYPIHPPVRQLQAAWHPTRGFISLLAGCIFSARLGLQNKNWERELHCKIQSSAKFVG